MLPRPYFSEQNTRRRQIDTLKIFNDNVIEITENEEYRVEFDVRGINAHLSVVLCPEFPNEKPIIYINPVIPHPWVRENTNEVTEAPGLLHYSPHSDLGQIVQAIIREFQRSAAKSSEECSEPSPQSHYSGQSLMFPELSEFTAEELQEILENPDLQDRLLENSPSLIALDLETEELMSSIERIAQDNITKQQMLVDLKTEIINSISTVVQMKINYEELNKKHQRLADRYDPHRIRDCVKAAALKADEDAETIAEEFLLGNVPVEMFVAKFSEKRALGQARRAREERLAHQLAQLDRATT